MDNERNRSEDLLDRFDLRSQTLLPRVGAALALVAIALIGWWLLRPAPPPVESVIPMASTSTVPEAASGPSSTVAVGAEAEQVVVAAAGSVARPGVYRLEPGSRVEDLVLAAGGFSDGADRDRVNLAAPVDDGERVWVPAQGDAEVPPVVAGTGTGSGSPGPRSADDDEPALIDLNAATEAELEELPGVGPATAASILSHRDEIGRFGSVDELLDVRGIGEAKLEQIRPLVTV